MKQLIFVMSLALCASSGSIAGVQLAQADLSFQSVDLNTDGYISITEAVSDETLIDQFTILDTDDDGMLTESEFGNLTDQVN